MNATVYFQMCSLLYFVLLLIMFISKERIRNIETKFYKIFLFVNFFGLLIDIYLAFLSTHLDSGDMLYKFVAKSYLVYFVTYISLLGFYMYIVSHKKVSIKNDNNKIDNYFTRYSLIYLFNIFLIIILPNYFNTDAYGTHSYGPATIYTYVCSSFYILLSIMYMIQGKKSTKFKKFVPIISFIVLITLTMIIQMIFPNIFLQPTAMTLTAFLMYFTIENPDVKMLDELHRSKEVSDSANDEKNLFIYNMTQESRKVSNAINDDIKYLLECDNLEDAKELGRDILNLTAKYSNSTYDILGVSGDTTGNFKLYNEKYNIKNILKEIVSINSKKCFDKGLEFRTNIDHNLPDILYGDSIKMKDNLNKLIDNSINNTKTGYIEFNVNILIKEEMCRLFININDSSTGYNSEDLKNILVNDKIISSINKNFIKMNGIMAINSNYGYGVNYKIIIDQKYDKNVSVISTYDSIFNNIKILVVDDNDSSIKIIDKLINDSNIKMDFTMNENDTLEYIKLNKYNLIFIDDDLYKIDFVNKIKKVNSNIVLLTKDNNYEYNSKYIDMGFCDYLLKPIKKDKLLSCINKYTKKDK